MSEKELHTHGTDCACGHNHHHHDDGCGCGHDHDHEHPYGRVPVTADAESIEISGREKAILQTILAVGCLPVARLIATKSDEEEVVIDCLSPVYLYETSDTLDEVKEIGALLRRAGDAPLVSAAVGEISQPPFLLNMTDRVVEKNGKRLKLTQLEYQIMKLFMENPDKALTREEILDTVWGRGYFGEVKIVDVNIRRLRLKIEDDAQEPRYIATVWGTGYKWSTD